MAAAEYLRAASAELRKAAQDLNQQVRSVQADFDHQRRHLDDAIKKHEMEIKTKEATIATMDDPNEIKGLRLQIAGLQKLVTNHKQELGGARGNADGTANAKLSFASQLESLAGQLDGMAGRPEAN